MSDVKMSQREESIAVDVWKYYGAIGGNDKDQMIKIVSLLLAVSAGIVSLYATDKLAEGAVILLFAIGAAVSVLAAFTALLYGGYAAWNWAIADRIAEECKWAEQRPSFRPIPKSEMRWIDRIPLCLAKPCENKVAPVFWGFFAASIVSLSIHVGLLVKCS